MRRGNTTRTDRGLGPFSGAQLTAVLIALILAIGFPVGAFALSFSNVSITDPHGVYRAFVNHDGELLTHATGKVAPTLADHPFSVTDRNVDGVIKVRLRCTTSPCRMAFTDVVMSQDNTARSTVLVVLSLYQDGGVGDCSTLGGKVRDILPNAYTPAGQVTAVSFATPVVVTTSPVCLRFGIASSAGLLFNYTVNGYWEST